VIYSKSFIYSLKVLLKFTESHTNSSTGVASSV